MDRLRAFIKRFRYSIAICLVAFMITCVSVYTMSAAGALPFGGFVVTSLPCTCTPGAFLLTISPPTPGQFVYMTGTPQFANMQLPRAGVWALGLFSPSGACFIYEGKSCVPLGFPIGTILPMVGTSF